MTDPKETETEIEIEIKTGEQEDGSYIVLLRNQNGITIGDEKLKYITLKEPDVAQLKGISLLQVNSSNVDVLKRLLPKITTPMLTAPIINKLKLSDLNRLAGGIMYFLYNSEIGNDF